MRITPEIVDHVASLARIGLGPEEREKMQEQLSAILTYVETLDKLDTSHVSPSAQVIHLENVTRPDLARPGLTLDDALANAPDTVDAYFRVPPVFEEE